MTEGDKFLGILVIWLSIAVVYHVAPGAATVLALSLIHISEPTRPY